MAETNAEMTVQDLVADYDRRDGCLSKAQAERLIEKRQLTIEESAEIYRQLEALGITLEDEIDDPPDYSTESLEEIRPAEPDNTGHHKRFGARLRDMSSKLLTAFEEVELGRQMELGRRARKEFESGVAILDEHIDVMARAARAREKMITANLRLVFHLARPYIGVSDLSIEDIFQEGTIGLIRAVEKFDHSLGYHFATYATWWIRCFVTRALADRGTTIRLPQQVKMDVFRLNRAHKLCVQKHPGRRPGIGELANELTWSLERVIFIQQAAALLPASWEESVPAPENVTIADIFASEQKSPARCVDQKELTKHVEKTLRGLKGREREVLRRRFGLSGYANEDTLETIGKLFELTRERIRQIEAKALDKLRHPKRSLPLRDFLDAL